MSKQRPSHVPVFISSTYEDLREYREAIQKVLVRLETIIKGMEFFGSRPGTPSSECLQVVEQSKIFLCVIGMRLGSIDDTTKKSIVQLEYEKAQDLKLPTLIYMIDEKTQPILPIYMDIGKKAKQLKEFKQLLKKRHVVSFVTSPEDLALKVSQDLPRELREIGIEIEQNIKAEVVKEKDGAAILRKFQMRPRKVNGQSVEVVLVPDKNGVISGVAPVDADVHGLPHGDAFRFMARCVVPNKYEEIFQVYAYGKIGDYIEENWEKIDKFNAIVRLSWGVREMLYKIRGMNYAEKRKEDVKVLIVTDILDSL